MEEQKKQPVSIVPPSIQLTGPTLPGRLVCAPEQRVL